MKSQTNPGFPQESNPDPKDHIGLAVKSAKIAAERWGGGTENWLGEAWLALVEASKNYNPEKARFSTYALKYIYWKLHKYRMLDAGYKTTNAGKYKKLPTIANTDLAISKVQNSHIKLEVEYVLSFLSKKRKEILHLKFLGYNNRQIASLLGVTHQCISNQVKYALKNLKEVLS